MPYLSQLDAFLRASLMHSADSMRDAQMRFIRARQSEDGGFAGRQGASDPYYTDFALRVTSLLAPGSDVGVKAATYLPTVAAPPDDVVAAFSLLNCRRMLDECGCSVEIDVESTMRAVDMHRLEAGGWSRAGSDAVSAYCTFIGALCHQLTGTPVPEAAAAADAVAALQTTDGGFREQSSDSASQINATAAAIAFLRMTGRVTAEQQLRAREYLLRMQAGDGGMLAHEAVPHGDLLSTFTGMLTLTTLGSVAGLDVQAAARFLRWVALPEGGFVGYIGDTEPDVEYTYYGLGCLALLSAYAGTKQQ
jgi:geranylgeranyl transferase type-2 subunit beta